jgi:hypothetical protein
MTLRGVGNGFAIPGYVIGGFGLVGIIAGAANEDEGGSDAIVGGAALLGAGLGLVFVGIPLKITGKQLKRGARNAYIKNYAPQAQQQNSLKINVHGNGVSLAYTF